MNKCSLFSISILLTSLMFFRCQPSGNLETILSGTVKGFEGDSLRITYFQNDHWESRQDIYIPIDTAGQFNATLPVHSLKVFWILKNRVVMKPGWKTTIAIHKNAAGKMDSSIFNGDGAEENEVYNKNFKLIIDSYQGMSKEPGEFITFLDSVDQVMKADVDDLKEADQDFVTMLHNNIAYHKMECWGNYVEQNFVRKGKDTPDSLKAYSSQFDHLQVFDNAELLNSFVYTGWLNGHFKRIVSDRVDFNALLEAHEGDREKARKDYDNITFNLKLDLADSIISDQQTKSFIYFDAYYNVLLRDIDPLLILSVKQSFSDRFLHVVKDTSMINYIANRLDGLEKLSPGMPAPEFSYPDTTGNLVSLSDFKGRYVYIDVWATWCRPCIAEMPKLNELEQTFGDKIAFVSVSIDTEKETWQIYVKENKLTGFQIYSQGGGKAEIMELYMIQAIPRFIMIDPDGNIINADATRPSDGKTWKIFAEWTGSKIVNNELI